MVIKFTLSPVNHRQFDLKKLGLNFSANVVSTFRTPAGKFIQISKQILWNLISGEMPQTPYSTDSIRRFCCTCTENHKVLCYVTISWRNMRHFQSWHFAVITLDSTEV